MAEPRATFICAQIEEGMEEGGGGNDEELE
jgi:hypothetical protein